MSKIRKALAPNRVATYLTVGAGGATAAAAVLVEADASTTTGLAVGYLGAVAAVIKWLDGWQKHEARTGGDIPNPTDQATLNPHGEL